MPEMMKMDKEEEGMMEPDEIELTLRRFAMSKNDQQLTKLLNSMFPTAEDLIAHETNPKDSGEDKKEGE